MKFNGTTIPTTRDNTYDASEVHRKSSNELYESAFNDDQREVLDDFEPSGGGSSAEPFMVGINESDGFLVLDKTFGEIRQAFTEGQPVIIGVVGGSRFDLVVHVEYSIDLDTPLSIANVGTLNNGFTVRLNSGDCSLEAIDASYPSVEL